MANREIIKMGNPILRQSAVLLTKEEILAEETQNLIKEMREIMKEAEGIGLAAPQIGISKHLAIIEIAEDSKRYPEKDPTRLMIFINPQITVIDEATQGFWEGCLSVPGLRGFVKRPRKIRIDYLNENAEEISIIAEDFLATVFQHEIDHLNGILYVDKITDMTLFSYNEEYVKFHIEEGDSFEQ
ncbi:MAG: peptide deformylase [Epsilonproteobacteria bacterium]|nr:MAG: peptide deformylase [Campylobacterota bacterium]